MKLICWIFGHSESYLDRTYTLRDGVIYKEWNCDRCGKHHQQKLDFGSKR